MRYMVMECHLSYAVVLDEEGRFLKVANMHYEVGQMVDDIFELRIPDTKEELEEVSEQTDISVFTEQKKKKLSRKWISVMTAMAACMVLLVTSLMYSEDQTYASVYMRINPEVCITINKKEAVVGLEGLNEDGKILLENYQYKKKSLDTVMDELVDLAIEMGYLYEGGQITLTLDAKDHEWIVSRGQTLNDHLNAHLKEKMSVEVMVDQLDEEGKEVPIPNVTQPTAGDSGYGESDYKETISVIGDEAEDEEPIDEGSDADGASDYETDEDDYEDEGSDKDSDDDGASDYETDEDDYEGEGSDKGSDDDGVSDYETDEDDYEDEGSDEDSDDDGASDYETGEDDYEHEESDENLNNGNTSINENFNSGDSGYGASSEESGTSDYETEPEDDTAEDSEDDDSENEDSEDDDSEDDD